MSIIADLKTTYVLKGVGVPEYYLGGNFDTITDSALLQQNIKTSMGARTYMRNIVERFERLFDGDEHPEVDDSPFLSEDMASK
jgi:hypothetical protein